MKIYSISDLHLSGADPKPMNVFGSHWDGHWEKIRESWWEKVGSGDLVLIPGDISWAMNLQGAVVDLEEIGQLPGQKIIIRGNHDYWWASVSKVRAALPQGMFALQNDYLKIGGMTFCGTRGWTAPGSKNYSDQDLKIFNREMLRLKLSLDSAGKSERIIVLLHYPPFNEKGNPTEMAEVLKDYPVSHVVFGHLHGDSLRYVNEGLIDGIEYHLVSCDYLDFELKFIEEI